MKLDRRRFLQQALIVGSALALSDRRLLRRALAQEDMELTGNISPVHDPCIIKEDDTYYLFCTGAWIPIRTSKDLVEWELIGNTFRGLPPWAREAIPRADSIWAPDISYFNGRYHLYYSVSTFGSNRSVIGLATNVTLNRDSPDYEWVDEGLVVETHTSSDHNAIDPNVVLDDEGIPWLSYGSHWSGIKMRRLDPETGKPSAEDDTLYSLASRAEHPRAVEAPFIIRKGGFYYLFVSFDQCCRGVTSTYRVMVGRSEDVTGPYVDRDGAPMLEDGGTQVTFATDRWRGPGHNAILQDGDQDYLVCHAYDARRVGIPTLRILPIIWDEDGWPTVDMGSE
jgi:arabinan endo-1,5-alpha-L-arabinosidase